MHINANPLKAELSIVIPVYDEEENVRILYHEIRNALDPLKKPYEVIFVDDGSSDRTWNYLNEIKQKEKIENNGYMRTRLIKFSRNFGQTAAMQAGFDQAEAEIIVSMDGDLQNDPADIPRVLGKIAEGSDIVCGWRKDRQDKMFSRILPSLAANWIIRKLTGLSIHDNGCSLKAYKESVIKTVRLYSDMHRFIPAVASMVGANCSEIVVNHRPRRFGRTKYSLTRIWKVLFDMITIKMLIHFSQRPVWWFMLPGLAFLAGGIGLGIASVIVYLKQDYSLIFVASSVLCFYTFASLLSWGLLAEFFVKIEETEE